MLVHLWSCESLPWAYTLNTGFFLFSGKCIYVTKFLLMYLYSRGKSVYHQGNFQYLKIYYFRNTTDLRYQKLCASYVLALHGYCLRCSCQKSSECRCSLLVFFSGSLRSGIETGGRVREKEREIFPFMFIAFLPLYTTSLYCACQAGYSSGSYEERTPGLRFPLC